MQSYFSFRRYFSELSLLCVQEKIFCCHFGYWRMHSHSSLNWPMSPVILSVPLLHDFCLGHFLIAQKRPQVLIMALPKKASAMKPIPQDVDVFWHKDCIPSFSLFFLNRLCRKDHIKSDFWIFEIVFRSFLSFHHYSTMSSKTILHATLAARRICDPWSSNCIVIFSDTF